MLHAVYRQTTLLPRLPVGNLIGATCSRGIQTTSHMEADKPCNAGSNKLAGKRAFIAGVSDDQGYGWAIAHALADQGVELVFGTWPMTLGIFRAAWKVGKYNKSRVLSNGKLLDVAKVYPLDAVYDTPADVPAEQKKDKKYATIGPFTVSEVAAQVQKDFGNIDFLVHALANGPEVKNPLLETSRKGYLAAVSASAYSNVSLLRHFGPIMSRGGASVSLTYSASERVTPGYGGGMASAKAALESDTRTLAWEAGRKYGVRVNTISAGPLRSRAARAIGFIDGMVMYSKANAPLTKDLEASEVGQAALFLLSPAASAVTGVTLYVDNGLHAMGLAVDSKSIASITEGDASKKN